MSVTPGTPTNLVTQDELTAGLADKVTDAELAAALSNLVTQDELTDAVPDRLSKNPVPTYVDDVITRIDYANGSYKTLTYTDGDVTQVDFVRPGLSTIRKVFAYSNGNWAGTTETEI